MSVRSRVADRPSTAIEVAKTYGTSVPEQFRQGEAASQMTPASPFSPGTPIGPYDGYDRQPRAFNYTTGYNISTRPRLHERVSFETLTGLVESYDIAQLAIWHRIDSIRSLEWKLVPLDDSVGDVSDAIDLGMAALRRPDRINSFETWLGKWLYDILAYDAGTLYRLRNRAGRCVGLAPVDGRTIAPLLDYWGNSPTAQSPGDPEPEAYVQYVNGLPWNWLTRSDLIYEPFRSVASSPYGRAPLESIILNANTDLRFQVYFLQRFTEGNLPAAFASSPDSWSPDQIEQFQNYWDSFMYSDQSRKHQIRWMPGGSKIAWSNEKDFSDQFSMFMLRKSLAAYHVVPSDMGFTEDVNRSSGESQADVQHRIGDLPLIRFVHRIVSHFLIDDLRLPLRFTFDLGEEQDDRLSTAQSDDIYAKLGVVGVSELREMRFGKSEPGGKPVPRFIFSNRAGAIPLSALEDVAGPVDDETGAPVPGAGLPHKEFAPIEGVVPVPPPHVPGLAEREYGPSALLEAPPQQPVAKEGEGAGITAETGVYSYDLEGRDEDEEPDPAALIAKELAAFRRFERTRRRNGEWRDFRFAAVDPETASDLNAAGRAAVRKDALVPVAAVLAPDCCGGECCQGDGGCCAGSGGCTCGPGEVAKAADAAPKVPKRERPGPEPVWGEIEERRAKLTRKHLKAVLAAWNDLTGSRNADVLVRQFRAEVQPVAKYADPNRNKAQAAALAWLTALYAKGGWAALVAAISDAIRSGMAEGEADALAVAAARQGAGGIAIDRAFAAAYERLADDGQISQQAADIAEKMVSGAAADVSGVLADADEDDADDEMAAAVDDTVTGNDVRSVSSWLQDAIWGAIGVGLVWLCGTAGAGTVPAPTGPGTPPVPPEPPGMIWISWVTDGNPCPACVDNEGGGPYTPDQVPAFPAHPHCQCELDNYEGDVPSSFFAAYLLN